MFKSRKYGPFQLVKIVAFVDDMDFRFDFDVAHAQRTIQQLLFVGGNMLSISP